MISSDKVCISGRLACHASRLGSLIAVRTIERLNLPNPCWEFLAKLLCRFYSHRFRVESEGKKWEILREISAAWWREALWLCMRSLVPCVGKPSTRGRSWPRVHGDVITPTSSGYKHLRDVFVTFLLPVHPRYSNYRWHARGICLSRNSQCALCMHSVESNCNTSLASWATLVELIYKDPGLWLLTISLRNDL